MKPSQEAILSGSIEESTASQGSPTDTLQPLGDVLTEAISSVEEREASAFEKLLDTVHNRLVIFGCGNLGKRAIEKVRELKIEPLALCDNNESLWGTTILGVPVLSLPEAGAHFGADSLFLVSVWNPHHWYEETAQKLRFVGARFISSYLPLYWRFPTDFLQSYLLNSLPSNVYRAKNAVLEAEQLWADECSLNVYRGNIYWRALGNPDFMPSRPSRDTYFPADIFKSIQNECFVDCGAFDGDTVRQVLEHYGNNFAAIYSLEGDAISFGRLQAYVTSLAPTIQQKVHLIHGAVGSSRAVVHFTSSGGTGSRMDDADGPGSAVQCYPLDELFITQSVTFIKMDIEGAEYNSLLGAQATIQRDRPILAICVYHTQEDIWRLPLLVHSMLPEHLLFLRAYEGDGFQTVLYAVPPDRMLSAAERSSAAKPLKLSS